MGNNARAIQYEADRPCIFDFLDYREFLQAWFEYLGESNLSFSLRALCLKCEISPSALYMVFSKTRSLSEKNLEKMLPYLELSASEANFLKILRALAESDDIESKLECYSRISRFSEYKDRAGADIRVFKYISAWYHIVIREMVSLPDFKPEVKWVRNKLKNKLSSKEIRQALDFLFEYGYLIKEPNGRVSAPDKLIKCEKSVLKLALAQAHEQVLGLAAESINNTESTERRLVNFTAAISKEKLDEINKVISKAVSEIEEITDGEVDSDSVYQFSFLTFPLTITEGSDS